MIKLNLGSGNDYRQGFVNIEINKDFKADIHRDLLSPLPFENSKVDYILLNDVLEHFTKYEGEQILTECIRVLKPGGLISIRIPNISAILDNFGDDQEVMMNFIYGNTEIHNQYGTHKFGYTENTIKKLLKETGFSAVTVSEQETNFEIEAYKLSTVPRLTNILISSVDSGGLGGAEVFISDFAQELEKNNISVNFLTVRNSDFSVFLRLHNLKFTEISHRIDVIGNWKGLVKAFVFLLPTLVSYIALLRQLKKRENPLILITGISDKIILSPLAKFFGIPVVWIEYAPLAPVFKKLFYFPKILYRLVKNTPQRVYVPTYNTLKHLVPETRISESKIKVIPLSIKSLDSKRLKKITIRSQALRNKFGAKSFIVGMVSRFQNEKGADEFIKAVKELSEKIKNIKCIIVGYGDTTYVESVIKSFNAEKYITVVNTVTDDVEKYAFIKSFDVAVFPTRWNMEGFGLFALEAMMLGIPLVASCTGPVPEVVGKAGIITDPNAKSIALSIYKLYKNKTERVKMGKWGIKRFKDKFDLSKNIVPKFINDFQKVISYYY